MKCLMHARCKGKETCIRQYQSAEKKKKDAEKNAARLRKEDKTMFLPGIM